MTSFLQDEMDVNRLFAASDIWPELTGSDHCPAWADLDFRKPLPMQETVPAFSTRNIFTGTSASCCWIQAQAYLPAQHRSPTLLNMKCDVLGLINSM